MRDLETHTGIDRFKNSHTREMIMNIGKDSNTAKQYMTNDPLSFNTNSNYPTSYTHDIKG